jgi:voltage-gated potassium channel
MRSHWRNFVQRRIEQLQGHVIVCGFGRMGEAVCEELRAAGREFVVVEPEQHAYERAIGSGYMAVHGSGSGEEPLLAAGIQRADSLITVADSETENIVIALSARELRHELAIVARAERDSDVRKLRTAGVNRTVSPFRSGGLEAARAVLNPHLTEFLLAASSGRGDIVLAEVSIDAGSQLDGVELATYGRSEGRSVAFMILERPGKDRMLPPPGSEHFQAGDRLIVAGTAASVQRMQARGRAPKP